jgi:hypothetical protein
MMTTYRRELTNLQRAYDVARLADIGKLTNALVARFNGFERIG